MSKKTHDKSNNTTNGINIIKHPTFNVHHQSINEPFNKYNRTKDEGEKKPVILKYIKNNLISRAIRKKKNFNQTSKSTSVDENILFNEVLKYPSLNTIYYNRRKHNNKNQESSLFKNSLLNQKYNKIGNKKINLTQVKDHYLRLNNIYDPHTNYSEIVSDRKHIINVFQSQTKNNFNNNYYLIYSDPDKHKRNYISKCFESIKNNNKKNIDRENSIKALLEKEIYNKKKSKIFGVKNKFNKKNNRFISFPSFFDMDNLFPKTNKFKIQTLNIAEEISKEYSDTFRVQNKKRLIQSALYPKKNGESFNFFRTIPKPKKFPNYENKKNF